MYILNTYRNNIDSHNLIIESNTCTYVFLCREYIHTDTQTQQIFVIIQNLPLLGLWDQFNLGAAGL